MKNLFAVAAPAAVPNKGGKKTKVEINIDGLKNYAVLDAAGKAIEALQATARAEINTQILEYFVTKGAVLGSQPENPRGIDDDASASLELRKKSSRQTLNEQEVKLLTANGIPTAVVTDKPATFIINPAYLQDAALMKRVGETLGKVKGMPLDFIQTQEAKTSVIVTDESLAVLFKKSATTIKELISVVGVTAVKASLADPDSNALLAAITELAEEL